MLSERDQHYLWHPLTQHKLHPKALGIVRARGSVLVDEDENEYIDGIASWYTCMYGHCNPFITQRVAHQMQRLDHVIFSGFTHGPAVELSENLVPLLPGEQQKLFFSDNGSTAVDIAIKMALQYYYNLGRPRRKLLAFDDGFHGDTFGAMSVSGLSVYNGPFEEFFLEVERIPVPSDENLDRLLPDLEALLATGEVAAFIYEPLVQGAAGMNVYGAGPLDRVLRMVRSFGTLTLADEVMTGFGKTGRMFASDYIATKPDIMCLSKALTGGLLPMAITSCTMQVYEAFYSDDLAKGLFHGHTYTANPLACTAALAALDLLRSDAIQMDIARVTRRHEQFDKEIRPHPKVLRTRQSGIIYALDLKVSMERYGQLRDRMFSRFMAEGVFLRPLGSTIYIQAPYIITDEELDRIYTAIRIVLDIV